MWNIILHVLLFPPFMYVSSFKCMTTEGVVPWWVILRIPGTSHFVYVDARSDNIYEMSYLWDEDSPLRVTMETSSLHQKSTDYMTFMGDWAHAFLASKDLQHLFRGFLVYEEGTVQNGGFWLMHNNSLFPPDMQGDVITNTSHPVWAAAAIEDPEQKEQSFYFCLSINGNDDFSAVLDYWLLTNPIIFKSHLSQEIWKEKLIKGSYPEGIFVYEKARRAFFECFYSKGANLVNKCVHQLVDEESGLSLVVRLLGMERHPVEICANFVTALFDGSRIIWDALFKPMSNVQASNDEDTRAIHVISQSSVCFGSAISRDMDVTKYMVCIEHRPLADLFWSLGLGEDWTCSSYGVSKMQTWVQSFGDVYLDPARWQQYHANVNSFALSKEGRLTNKSRHPSSTCQDIYITPEERRKILHVTRNEALNNFVLFNPNPLLGIFYRKGCRYCDTKGTEIRKMADLLWTYHDIDVVMIDVMVAGLPQELYARWVPHIRCRLPQEETKESITGSWHSMSHSSLDASAVLHFVNVSCIKNITIVSQESKEIKKMNSGKHSSTLSRVKRNTPNIEPQREENSPDDVQQDQEGENPAEQCENDLSPKQRQATRCGHKLQVYLQHNKPIKHKCVGQTGIQKMKNQDKAISLKVFDGCEPMYKGACPKEDKRRLFIGGEGCSVLKGALIQKCEEKVEELYEVSCINGQIFRGSIVGQDYYDYEKKITYDAEGHLVEYLKEQESHIFEEILSQRKDHCVPELWMTMNYNPCFKHCSGAAGGGHQNIPEVVSFLEKKLAIQSLTTRIAFGSKFVTKLETQAQFEAAVSHMVNKTFKIYMCDFDDDWWQDLQIYGKPDVDKMAKKTEWQAGFNKTFAKLTDNLGLQIGRKGNCIYPKPITSSPPPNNFFIDPDWPDI